MHVEKQMITRYKADTGCLSFASAIWWLINVASHDVSEQHNLCITVAAWRLPKLYISPTHSISNIQLFVHATCIYIIPQCVTLDPNLCHANTVLQ